MKKKNNYKNKKSSLRKATEVVVAIILSLGGGFLISFLTRDAMGQFSSFKQPPLAPPAWLFPIAWSILYILMGVASYLIFNLKKSKERTVLLVLYLIQLGFNFLWTIIFFNLGWFWVAAVWLAIMWAVILTLMIRVKKLSPAAFYLLLPYILWCSFAMYLNISIAILN